MIITKKDINILRKNFWRISDKLENEILEKFGKEPEPDENGHFYEYTEQDLYEQIRKMSQNKH